MTDPVGLDEPGPPPESTPSPSSRPARRRRPVARVLLVAAVVGVCYLGVAWWASRSVPSRASVAGLAIGGMSGQEAQRALAQEAIGWAGEPLEVRLGGQTARIVPADAGVGVDAAATVAPLTRLSLDPRVLVSRLAGGGEVPAVTRVDAARFEEALRPTVQRAERPVREASVSFTGGTLAGTRPEPGSRVDLAATAEEVARSWPERDVVQGVVDPVAPRVSAQAYEQALDEVARPAATGPLGLRADGRTASLTAVALAPALSMVEDAGTLHLRVLEAPLLTAIRQAAPELEHSPVDASLRADGDRPRVVPSVTGRVLDGPRSVDAVTRALTVGPRVAELALQDAAPRITEQRLQDWSITSEIGRASVRFADPSTTPERVANAARAATLLDGAVVAPGAVFDFNGRVGLRASSRGFVAATGPFPGEDGEDDAGVSHVSSAVHEAAYRAGLALGPRAPHSVYLTGLTAGLDARATFGSANVTFTAPDDSGVWVSASARGDTIEVRLWGAAGTATQVSAEGPTSLVRPGPAVERPSRCVPRPAAQPGFDITVTRVMTREGREVGRESIRTRYAPIPAVTCAR